jgi:hypothetical protein
MRIGDGPQIRRACQTCYYQRMKRQSLGLVARVYVSMSWHTPFAGPQRDLFFRFTRTLTVEATPRHTAPRSHRLQADPG